MEAMLRTDNCRRLSVALIVLWLAFWWVPAGALPAVPDTPPETGQLSSGEGGVYRVQVAAYFSSRRAKKAKKKIEKDARFANEKIVIEFSSKSGVYRVDVGEFNSRGDAEGLQRQLADAGFEDAEVVVDHYYSTAAVSAAEPPPPPTSVPAATSSPVTNDRMTVDPAEVSVIGHATVATQRSDYVIGPEDLLEVSVFELEGLNKTVRVSEEGMITLPLLGAVRAEGQTRRGLEEIVRSLLEEKYINSPQVSVFIREFRSRSVSVIGSVRNPGTYKLLGARTLIHMISEAGGLSDKAGPLLYVIRVSPEGASERIAVDLDGLMIQGRAELNLLVESADVINIPADPQMSVYIYGAVRSPGELSFRKSDAISLLQAITKAGGLTDRAAADKVRIKRKSDSGVEQQIDVKLKKIIKGKKEDMPLQDKDVVVVPETIF